MRRSEIFWAVCRWCLLAVSLLALSAMAMLAWSLQPAQLRPRVEAELARRLGMPVQLRGFDYTWRDALTCELTGLTATPAAGRPWQLDRLRVATGLGPQAAGETAWHIGRLWRVWRSDPAAPAPWTVVPWAGVQVELARGPLHVRVDEMAWTPERWQLRLTVEPVNLREALPRLGVALPPTTDPAAFTAMQGHARCMVSDAGWQCHEVRGQLDGSQLAGEMSRPAAVAAMAPSSVAATAAVPWHFDFRVDRLNLDRYLPPIDPREPPFTIPWQAADAWPLDGQLQVARLQLGGMELHAVQLRLRTGAQGLQAGAMTSSP